MAFKEEPMVSKLHALIASAGLLACTGTIAAEYRIEITSDPEGQHFVVEKQNTSENPVLITKRVGPDKSTHYMKRSIDCKNWKVRNLGEGPTLDAMNKGQPDPEPSTIEAGSIPDHFARHACPPPHPAAKP
jgi:hypothetical protein